MILRLRFLLFCLMTVHFSNAVDYDYYFSALRSKRTCNNTKTKLNCQVRCGEDTGMCIENDCFCLSVSSLKDFKEKGLVLKAKEDSQSYNDYYDHNEMPDNQYDGIDEESSQDTHEYLDESLLDDKPILRHHIAHFCPNLEVARNCIRTCMTQGKPAFCGKDHVCYCGHKYSNKDRNSETDASSVYAQFKDLYEKYFGPKYKQQIQV